jgi:hypothetical protein
MSTRRPKKLLTEGDKLRRLCDAIKALGDADMRAALWGAMTAQMLRVGKRRADDNLPRVLAG